MNVSSVKTIGETTVVTSEKYVIEGQDIVYDDQKKLIYSEHDTKIKDLAGNEIVVQMFNYLTLKNMFLSKGEIEITDLLNKYRLNGNLKANFIGRGGAWLDTGTTVSYTHLTLPTKRIV